MNRDLEYQSFYLALQKTKTSNISSLAAAALFSVLIYVELQTLSIVWWFFLMVLQLAARQIYADYLLKVHKETKEGIQNSRTRFGLIIFLSAASWGVLGPLFITTQINDFVTMLTVIFAVGILAGAIFSLSNIPSYFYIFSAVLSVPIILSFLFIGQFAASLTMLGFLVFTILSSRDVRASVLKNLELNIKNAELIQELQHANKLKGEFLANMSHEIRTPMNAILGFLQLLRNKEQDTAKIDYLNTIESSGKDLLHIIDDILDFSKIESDQLQFETVTFSPKERVEQSITLYSVVATSKNITLATEFSSEIPGFVESDPTRFTQIINNLLSNAIKFSKPQDAVCIKLDYESDTQQLFVSVKDHGIGIPKEKLNEVFKPFTQADSSTTREFGGTGLGLSICHGLVEKLEGKINVSSQEGKGTEFIFCIKAPITKKPIQQADSSIEDYNKQLKAHILIVEDNKTNQLLVSKILEKIGLSYDIANDGAEGVQCFKKNTYDIILMDENMPNLTGIQATKEIRSIESENRHTPIIGITANSMKGDKERFIEAGMDAYINKPIIITTFIETIHKFLRK